MGLRHHQLVAFAAHGLDDNRECELAAAGDLKGVRLFGVVDAQADVSLLLEEESLAQLARGDEFAFAAGPGELLALKIIAMVGSSMRSGGSGLGSFAVGDGIADADVLDAGDGDDIAASAARDFDCASNPASRRPG